MAASDPLLERLAAEAEENARLSLAEPSLAAVGRLMEGTDALQAFELLRRVTYFPESTAHLEARRGRLPGELAGQGENLFERWLLVQASLHAMKRVGRLPVYRAVKRLFFDEFRFFAAAPEAWRARFRLEDIRFREMARIATLQRFPAGQMHWDRVPRLPRGWLLAPRWPEMLALWRMMAFGFRGLGPLAETHTNDRREGGPHFRFEDRQASYYRLARSIELQPEMKGMMSESWYYCAETVRVSPHLAWARQFFLDHGGAQVDLGPAAEDSGFLATSETRRRLYAEGKYKPSIGLVIWPRRRMLEWAAGHPELAED